MGTWRHCFMYNEAVADNKSLFRVLWRASIVGVNLVVATFVGLAMGYYIDLYLEKWFGWHTSPWFLIIFLILGIITGFRDLFRMAREGTKDEDDKTDS